VDTLTLELPRESVASLGTNDIERRRTLRLELALALYREGKLSPGSAAELAGLGRWEFADIAKIRGVPTPYTKDMIEEDFSNASRRK
jgi:predicted HTH domain antitoxin